MDEKEVIVHINGINEIESHDWNGLAFSSNSAPHVEEEHESWGGKVTFVRLHHAQGIESDMGHTYFLTSGAELSIQPSALLGLIMDHSSLFLLTVIASSKIFNVF